jgi:hypothetical protein
MLWLPACPAMAQESVFPVRYDFDWKNVEQHVPAAVVDEFIKGSPAAFGYFKQKVGKYHTASLDTLAIGTVVATRSSKRRQRDSKHNGE